MAGNATETSRGKRGTKIYENKGTEKTSFAGMSLKDKLRSIAMGIRIQDREHRLRRNSIYYLMALYYMGYQNIELDAGSGVFNIYEKDDFFIENQFRPKVDTVVNALCDGEGDFIARPASQEPQDIATSNVAGPVMDSQKIEIGYEQMKMVKNLYKALFGNAFIFVDFIRDAKNGTIVQPKYSYQEMTDPEDPEGDPYLTKMLDGVTTVNRGKEVGVVCSPLEVSVPPDCKGFANTPWLQWTTKQSATLLNYMYPGLGASGGRETSDDLAQQYLQILANLPGNALGDTTVTTYGTTAVPKCEYSRTWLTCSMFAGDKELERMFPNGVHVATVDGQVVDYYAEDLFDRWSHEVLIASPHSLLGDGLYDAMMVQDIMNEANSLMLKHIRYSTIGHNIFDTRVIDIKNITNDPENGWIPGTPQLEQRMSDAVVQIRPGQLSPEVGNWIVAKGQSLQDMTSAYDPAMGKGIGANTPYSQSVFLTERAQGRWKGSTKYNQPELIRFHKQLLKIAQTEWTEDRQMAVKSNSGAWSFQKFSQADLTGEVDVVITNKDMAPKGRAEQVQALTMLQSLQPIMVGLSPKQKLHVEEMLGLPPDSNPTNTQIARAYRHIDRISNGEVVAPLAMVDDPNAQVPVFMDYLASQPGEDLANSNPEAYSNIYVFMVTLMQMLQMQQGFVMPGAPPPQPGGGQQAPGGEQSKPPGGQPGQQGGGKPNAPGEAQSPAPAPPIAPPSPQA